MSPQLLTYISSFNLWPQTIQIPPIFRLKTLIQSCIVHPQLGIFSTCVYNCQGFILAIKVGNAFVCLFLFLRSPLPPPILKWQQLFWSFGFDTLPKLVANILNVFTWTAATSSKHPPPVFVSIRLCHTMWCQLKWSDKQNTK